MANETLVRKIDRLPPERQADVEDYVDHLLSDGARALTRELLDEIDAGREALARRHGPVETDDILRALREHGDE